MSRGSFLERWSRRKLTSGDAQETQAEPAERLDETKPPATAEATRDSVPPDEETLDEAELARLPPLDEITVKTDLAPFLRKGVPQALKNAALRKMWMLDPAIRDHKDFAVDYAWDWNVPGGVPGNAGTISGKSLAKMLESLNPKPVEAASTQARPADRRPARDVQESAADTATEAPPRPSQEAVSSGPPDATEAEEGDDRSAPPEVRPRRHGGAAPV